MSEERSVVPGCDKSTGMARYGHPWLEYGERSEVCLCFHTEPSRICMSFQPAASSLSQNKGVPYWVLHPCACFPLFSCLLVLNNWYSSTLPWFCIYVSDASGLCGRWHRARLTQMGNCSATERILRTSLQYMQEEPRLKNDCGGKIFRLSVWRQIIEKVYWT